MNLGADSLRPPTLWLARPESLRTLSLRLSRNLPRHCSGLLPPGTKLLDSRLVLQIVWNCECVKKSWS